ncbi:MAG: ADOP family duplicated permease [Gemmatimonadaceae bacterium]
MSGPADRPPGWRPAFRLPFGRRVEADVEEEIAFHLAMREERLRARGLPPEAARDAARRRFGDVEHVRREMLEIDRGAARRKSLGETLEDMMQDFVFALRGLRRAPGFALAALLTLALGIGSAAAIFSVAYGVLLRPLPFREPDQLVKLGTQFPAVGVGGEQLSGPEYFDIAGASRSFASVAVYDETDRTLGGDGRPERVRVAYAAAGLFPTLGVQPALGRAFTAEEDRPGGAYVIVLGHGLWTRRFGADPAIVGKQVYIDGVARTVLGVLPRGVRLGASEAYLPLRLGAPNPLSRMAHNFDVLARLEPGVTLAQARAELDAYARRATEEFPDYKKSGFRVTARPLRDSLFGEARPMMAALVGTVVLLLLLASVNVANLLLVRAEARQRELGVRVALGASRGRLVRQLLTESLVLAVAGALIGVPLAALGVKALLAINPDVVPPGAEVSLDAGVVAVVALIVALAALVTGVAPALHAGHTDVRAAIAAGGAAGGRRGGRVRALLVGAEVALAAVMLTGAGLVARSFWNLLAVDPGFDPRGALVVELELPRTRYDTAAKINAFYARAIEGLRALPGAQTVAGISHLPLGGELGDWMLEAEGRPASAPPLPSPDFTIATADVFKALRVAVREGRTFAETDRPDSPPVVVVSREFARAFWPGESALGHRVRFMGPPDASIPWMTVVGVVEDVHRQALSKAPRPTYYILDTQFPRMVGQAENTMTLVVRTAGDPAPLAGPARAIVRALDPELAIGSVRTLDAVVASSVSRPRFAVAVLGAFGLSALLLALIGVYGVLSYAMTRRRRELAVRMALGARPHEVRRLVVGSGLKLAGAGLLVGLAAALAGGRVLHALLFEVSPTDPATLLGVGAVLVAAALLASWIPARRATAVSPAEVLRGE